MARVQKAFKVARMNAILKECDVERQPGLKMADKAALIVEKVPRDRLLNFLENPAEDAPAKESPGPSRLFFRAVHPLRSLGISTIRPPRQMPKVNWKRHWLRMPARPLAIYMRSMC